LLASAPKNPQPTQNTITRDNSVPAFLKVQQTELHKCRVLKKFIITSTFSMHWTADGQPTFEQRTKNKNWFN